jgi:hypothetical protein
MAKGENERDLNSRRWRRGKHKAPLGPATKSATLAQHNGKGGTATIFRARGMFKSTTTTEID